MIRALIQVGDDGYIEPVLVEDLLAQGCPDCVEDLIIEYDKETDRTEYHCIKCGCFTAWTKGRNKKYFN